MKIDEVTNVVNHPALKRKEAFDNLLMSDDQDDIIAFIMDDNNTQERRLALLKRLDLMIGQEQEEYGADDLEDFMHDQGPSTSWREELHRQFQDAHEKHGDSPWAGANDGITWDDVDIDRMGEVSDEDMIQMAKDLKIPPYHLSVVDEETFSSDADIPTGEYDLCDKCFGDGCPECEEGLIDVTGTFELPDFSEPK